ncbi:hypothetical protein IJM86_08330 [bacterium]|nr:hypothetical protein [bacterium]
MAITPLLAQKLEAVFNIDRQFWLNFEQVYQEQKKKLGVPKEKNTRNILHDVVSFKDFSPVTA